MPLRPLTPALGMTDVREIYSQGTFSPSKDFFEFHLDPEFTLVFPVGVSLKG